MKSTSLAGATLALLVVLLAVGTAPAATSDTRLLIRGLRLPRGAQTATLTGRLSPPPSVKSPLQATLTLGGTRIVLSGTALRNGKFVARARRVDLLDAGRSTHGGQLRMWGFAIDETIVLDAADCVASARGATRTCACATCAGPTPIDELPDGVYELASTEFPGPGLARFVTFPLGERTLFLVQGLFTDALLDVSRTVLLAGEANLGRGVSVAMLGSATASHGAEGWRVDGAIEGSGASGTPFSWAFALQRPDTGTPSTLGGPWRIELRRLADVAGTLPLTLQVAASGHATTQPTSVEDPLDASWALQFPAGRCFVAPAGQLSCFLQQTNPRVIGLRLHGRLDLDAGSGAGDFAVASSTLEGTWTATRP